MTAEGLEIRSVLGFTALEVDGVADLDGGNARTSLRNELVEEKHFTYGLSLEGGQEENVGWRVGTYHQFSGYDYTQDIRLGRGAVTCLSSAWRRRMWTSTRSTGRWISGWMKNGI